MERKEDLTMTNKQMLVAQLRKEQEQIEKMARSMCGYCSTDGKCAVSKNGREPDICANVDTEHCLYKEYAERLIESGYGKVSEYEAEIERLKSNNGFLQCVISHSKDMLDEAVIQAQKYILGKFARELIAFARKEEKDFGEDGISSNFIKEFVQNFIRKYNL